MGDFHNERRRWAQSCRRRLSFQAHTRVCPWINALRSVIGDSLQHDSSRTLAQHLIDFVHDAQQQLREDERLPMSEFRRKQARRALSLSLKSSEGS
ncbi:MAG: hypothetical protein CMJ64_11550 [Planctomycetaceae bacterium]|nr:hypothetical protein [Planctomycetaceae bacterium]